MRTSFQTREQIAQIFYQLADAWQPGPCRPTRFIAKMKTHWGLIGEFTPYGLDDQGLERRNPLIVAMGDSVTAGRFETLLLGKQREEYFATVKQGIMPAQPLEIADARQSYVEKFRAKLIDRFEITVPSVINAGIAGDTISGMFRRARRDIVSHQPDLVLINGSLNWNEEMGNSEVYAGYLRELVRLVKQETMADIILLTPNDQLPDNGLAERVEKIRAIAAAEQVCLADVYAVWQAYRRQGYDYAEILANGTNHPSTAGHEVYARVLMKLMQV